MAVKSRVDLCFLKKFKTAKSIKKSWLKKPRLEIKLATLYASNNLVITKRKTIALQFKNHKRK